MVVSHHFDGCRVTLSRARRSIQSMRTVDQSERREIENRSGTLLWQSQETRQNSDNDLSTFERVRSLVEDTSIDVEK